MFYFMLNYDDEKYWIECDDDNYAVRQVFFDEHGNYHISCMEDCLIEGVFCQSESEGEVTYIRKDEFEEVWQNELKKYERQWNIIKENYRIGDNVKGICKYFYPQGAIIYGENFRAVYKETIKHVINQEISGTICGYDEVNMWLVII